MGYGPQHASGDWTPLSVSNPLEMSRLGDPQTRPSLLAAAFASRASVLPSVKFPPKPFVPGATKPQPSPKFAQWPCRYTPGATCVALGVTLGLRLALKQSFANAGPA